MATIDNYLAQIKSAVYGEEVRDSIIGAIRTCYDDGKAGVIDTTARNTANAAQASINDYRASTDPRIQALEQATDHNLDAYWQMRDSSGGTPIDNATYWEIGSISSYSTDDQWAYLTCRARTPAASPLYFKSGDIIYCTDYDQVLFMVYWDGGYSEWISSGQYTIPSDGYYRLVIRRTAEDQSEVLGTPYKLSKYMHCFFPETLGAYNKGYILPKYYYANNYWKNTIDTINGLVNNTINGISFCFITDPHFSDETNYKRSKFLLKDILDKTSVPFVICGGDIVSTPGKEDCLMDGANTLLDYQNYIGKDKFFTVRGNHDFTISASSGSTIGKTLSTNKTYSYLMKNQERYTVQGEHTHMAWYLDIPNQRTRIVGLNSCDSQTTDNDLAAQVGTFVSQAQVDWLINDVLGMVNYRYIFISHVPADPAFENYYYNPTQQVFHDIIGAFKMRGKINTSYAQQNTGNMSVTVNADFTNTSSIVVCHITGHCHVDHANYDNKYDLWSISTGCDAYYNENFYDKHRAAIDEHLFDVFNINYNSRTITAYRVGAYNSNVGRTRIWTYESDVAALRGANIIQDGTEEGQARHAVTGVTGAVLQNYSLDSTYDASLFTPSDGDQMTIRIKGTIGTGHDHFSFVDSNSVSMVQVGASDYNSAKGYYEKDFVWQNATGVSSHYYTITQPTTASTASSITWLQIEPKNVLFNGDSPVSTSSYEMRSYSLTPNRIQTGDRYKITLVGRQVNSGSDAHFGINLYDSGINHYHVPLVQLYPSHITSTDGNGVSTYELEFNWNQSYYYSSETGRPTRTVDNAYITVFNVPQATAGASYIKSVSIEKVDTSSTPSGSSKKYNAAGMTAIVTSK